MKQQKAISYIKLHEECKRCIRFGHPIHKCGGREIQPTPCMAFKEHKESETLKQNNCIQ